MQAVLTKYRTRLGLILLAYIAFISLGLPDGLLGVAWPSIRASFSRPLDSLGMMLVASTAGYLTSSFASGRIIARLGVGKTLAFSCAATGLGMIGYTLAPAWWMMVTLAVLAGLGAGAIDAGLNTYVASHFGEGLMQWLHACFGIGVTLGPIIMTLGLTHFNSWRVGYATVGTAQLALATCFMLTLAMWKDGGDAAATERPRRLTDYKTPIPETLRQGAVWLSMLLFFIYTGIEATLGNWTYSLLTEARGIVPQQAGFWAGSYWATFTVGRTVAGLYARRVGVHTIVRTSLLAALCGALILWWNPVEVASLVGVGIIGLAIAPIFPALVSGTSARVSPRFAANTIGIQIGAAGLGAATLPGFAGFLARRTSLEVIPVYVLAAIVLLFGLYAVSLRREDTAAR